MKTESILTELYSREKELNTQLAATRSAIVGFGGKLTGADPIPTIKITAPSIASSKDKGDRKLTNTQKYIIEILKEENRPMSNDEILQSINNLGIKYSLNSIRSTLPLLNNIGSIKRISNGVYSHADWEKPKPLINNVKTIIEIEDYFNLRKEVTRKELISHFVKGGRFTEGMVDIRLDKLIKACKIKRKETGVYKLVKRK